MKTLAVSLTLFVSLGFGQASQTAPPQIVDFPSGNLHLKGYLWKPSGPGPFPAILFNHGSGGPSPMETSGTSMKEAAETLASVFVKHGYAFLYPCRRGHGLSAGQGRFIQDELKQAEAANGIQGRQKLQLALMTGAHLDDTLAGLSFLKSVPGVDAHRIAAVGHSFGGQLTILAAERDPSLRAVIDFGAAANSWAKSAELRERLIASVRKSTVPMMLIHAANDYDTAPGRELAEELERSHKTHVLKIYPAVGQTADEGHNLVHSSIRLWEADVFRFLDENVRK